MADLYEDAGSVVGGGRAFVCAASAVHFLCAIKDPHCKVLTVLLVVRPGIDRRLVLLQFCQKSPKHAVYLRTAVFQDQALHAEMVWKPATVEKPPVWSSILSVLLLDLLILTGIGSLPAQQHTSCSSRPPLAPLLRPHQPSVSLHTPVRPLKMDTTECASTHQLMQRYTCRKGRIAFFCSSVDPIQPAVPPFLRSIATQAHGAVQKENQEYRESDFNSSILCCQYHLISIQ